jgi:hypothetical protein
VVDRQEVPVRVLEEGLVADAGVERIALELHTARLELSLSRLEVITAIVRLPVSNSTPGI